MQEETQPLDQYLERIFEGEAGEKEKQQFSRWLASLDLAEQQLSVQEIESRRLKFQELFHQQHLPQAPPIAANPVRKFPDWLPYMAAAVLLIISGIGFWFTQQNQPQIYAEVSTLAGQRKVLTLSDGSSITLNYNSKLRYPQRFDTDRREVFLEGEAFFQVSHDKKRPFVVRNASIRVQVLGTSFDIAGYASEAKARVTVNTGKVAVQASGNKTLWMLTPGQQLTYDKLSNTVSRSNVNAASVSNWQSGRLEFNKQTLEAICRQLERDYQVRIDIRNEKLRTRRLSLETKNESLQNVLKILGIAGGFKYQMNGSSVIIWYIN